jgi:polar amino acid transport system permease protein
VNALDDVRPLPALIAAVVGAAGLAAVLATLIPPAFRPFLAEALGVTVVVTVASLALTLALVAVLVPALAHRSAWARAPARVLIAAGRAVPLVCTLLLVYWVPPLLGFDLAPLWCAVLAIGTVEACYLAVILDGLRVTVQRRHGEVAYLLGLRPATWWGRVMLPQLLRLAVPHLLNALLYTLKSSALASFIAVQDLTHTAGIIATATADPVAAYAVVLFAYLTLAAGLTLLGVMGRAALARRAPFVVVGSGHG